MYAQTNAPYPNRVQLVLNPYTGPLTQVGPLGAFTPSRDLSVYVDGVLQTIQSSSFDALNNRYLLYMPNMINLQGVVQVVFHIPSPTFISSGIGWGLLWGEYWGFSPGALGVPGFALIASYSTSGDSSLLASMSIIVTPNPAAVDQPVLVLWETSNVAQVEITGDNGVDPAIDSGLIPTTGNGFYNIYSGFTQNIVLSLNGFDSMGNPIVGLAPVSTTLVILDPPFGWGFQWGNLWG